MVDIIALEILKTEFSFGKNLEECRKRLIEVFRKKNIPIPDEERIIQLFSQVEEYNKYVLSERVKNTARPHFIRTRVWREFEVADLETKMPHWYRYRKSLKENDWTEEDIRSIQESSTDILDAIKDAESRKWNSSQTLPVKGLVIGHVQSGKTSSIAGVMALAADFEYDMVIVLSGIHNALNEQTTKRFEKDLWTYVMYGQSYRPRRDAHSYVQILKSRRSGWYNITDESDNLRNGQKQFLDIAKPVFGVFKKNATILRNLNRWIGNNGKFFGDKFKLLIIDDECDQASPNTADYESNEESAINGQLSRIIYNQNFPYVTYIGYTATPFASILNEPPGAKSLYPEDFIHTLRKPARHFGIKEVFGQEDSGEIPMAVKMNPKTYSDENTYWKKELKRAVAYFIAVCASRNHVRNQQKYITMLVHTSPRIEDHRMWKQVLSEIIDDFKAYPEILKKDCRVIWEEQRQRLNPSELARIFGLKSEEFIETEPFGTIRDKLYNVLTGNNIFEELKISIDNSKASDDERLNYPDLNLEQNKPHPVIVVGGNTLSRGLTLEGLTVSFFMREVSQMDSLLQMGRWFGYRRGYEDLVRVWTTGKTLGFFQHIGKVEMDLRDQVESLYTSSGVSPGEVALTVRTHPSMRIVRKNAMQAAVNKAVFFGTAPETSYFKHRDKEWLENNWHSANQLLSGLTFQNNRYANAGAEQLLGFLDRIKVHPLHEKIMGPEFLISFILKSNTYGHLLNWNIAVASQLNNKNYSPTKLENYKYLVRSKLAEPPPGFDNDANIKTLRSPGDLFTDMHVRIDDPEERSISSVRSPSARAKLFEYRGIEHGKRAGLLLLFPIKKSASKNEIKGEKRLNLDAVSDVLGWSIIFPGVASEDKADIYERVGIEL